MVMNRTQQDADFVFASTSRHQKPFTGVGMKNRPRPWNASSGLSTSEFLLTNDPGRFAHHDKLVRANVWNGFNVAIWPPDAEVGDSLRPQSEVQALIVHRIEAGLSAHFMSLLFAAIADRYSRPDRTAIAAHANQLNFQPMPVSRKIVAQQRWRLVHIPDKDVDVSVIVEIPERAAAARM